MKKGITIIFPLLLVFLFSSLSYAQKQNEIDRCFNYMKAGDYRRAIEAGKKAVKLYPKKMDSYHCLGDSYRLSGQLNLALSNMKTAEKLATSKQDLSLAYNRIGLIYSSKGDLDNAIMYNSRQLGLERELGDSRGISTAMNNLAMNYNEKGETDKALEYYEESLRLTTDDTGKASIYNNMAIIYVNKNDYRRAVEHLEKAININKRMGNYHSLAINLLNLGNTYRQMKNFDTGLTTLLEGLAMIKKIGDKFWEAIAYKYIGWLYQDKGNTTSATANLVAAYQLYESIGAKAEVADVLYSLNRLEEARKPRSLYAGIEVGSKGVKGMVVEISPTDKEGFFNINEIMRHTINTSIISGVTDTDMFRDDAIEETARAVKKIMDIMAERANVKKEDIHIVGSNALEYAQNVGVLERRVRSLTGIKMDFVNNKGEVFFGIIGSMPYKYQTSALLIDIGSGNTKIGYLEDNGRKTVSIEIPYGTVSFSEAAKKTNRFGKDYSLTLSSMSARQLTPLLKQELIRKPAILERKPVFMTGGVVWAMATILYPEKKDAFLNLTADDITKFYDMAVRKKSGIFNVDHARIKNKEARENAENQLNSVKNVFTADDIIAGATLLKAVSEDLRLKGRDIYFSRYGGWLFGYVSAAGCNIEDKKKKTGI